MDRYHKWAGVGVSYFGSLPSSPFLTLSFPIILTYYPNTANESQNREQAAYLPFYPVFFSFYWYLFTYHLYYILFLFCFIYLRYAFDFFNMKSWGRFHPFSERVSSEFTVRHRRPVCIWERASAHWSWLTESSNVVRSMSLHVRVSSKQDRNPIPGIGWGGSLL